MSGPKGLGMYEGSESTRSAKVDCPEIQKWAVLRVQTGRKNGHLSDNLYLCHTFLNGFCNKLSFLVLKWALVQIGKRVSK